MSGRTLHPQRVFSTHSLHNFIIVPFLGQNKLNLQYKHWSEMNIFPFVVYKMSVYVLILTNKLLWGKYYKHIFTNFKLIVIVFNIAYRILQHPSI